MRSNRIPMTIQVAICCENRSIVLAGDTKVRTSELSISDREPVSTAINRSKMAFSERHGMAVAMAGDGPVGTDAAAELTSYLSTLERIPDFLGPLLKKWGDDYFRKHRPDGEAGQGYPLCSMLVVNPNTKYCRLWKLRVNRESTEEGSESYMVNGHNNNSAVFWLEYMKADKKLPLEESLGVAIVTVGLASEINNFGIGGTELHEYRDAAWHHWAAENIERVESSLMAVQAQIKQAVIGLGHRPVTPAL